MKIILYAALLAVSSAAWSQMPLTPAPTALVVGAVATPMLRTGREVQFRTLVELTTLKKALQVGQRVPLEVAEAVTLNGQVVIPVGTPATGEITMVRNKGMWGKSGAFSGRVISMRVGDREIRMSGLFDDKGRAGGGAAVATSALVFLPAGFFMTGTSAALKIGTPVKGFFAEDIPVQLAPVTPPAPIMAQSASPAPTLMQTAATLQR